MRTFHPRLLFALARALMAVLLPGCLSVAHGHASLVGSDPPHEAVLSSPPGEVVLHFNEPVSPLVFKLVRPDGEVRALQDVVPVGDDVRVNMSDASAIGSFTLSWRIVSADGHPVGGVIAYSVGRAADEAAGKRLAITSKVGASVSTTRVAAIWVVRLGLYLTLIGCVGAVVFRHLCAVETLTGARWCRVAMGIGIGLLPLAIGLQGLDAMDAPWSALADPSIWRAGATTSYATTCLLMLVSLLAAGVALRPRSVLSASSAVFSLLLLGLAAALSGHASTAPPQWLARPTVMLHVIGVTLWIGSLVPLAMTLLAGKEVSSLSATSRLLGWAVPLLVTSGAVLVVLQMAQAEQILSTDYGRILVAKIALVAVMLSLGAANRWLLTPRVLDGDAEARQALRRTIVIEIACAVVVLGLVATWRFTPPPRSSDSPGPTTSIAVHLHSSQATADLTLLTGGDRRVIGTLLLQGPNGGVLDAKEVSLTLSNRALGIESLSQPARSLGNGRWAIDAFLLPANGRWHLTVDALISDFDQIRWEDDVELRF